MTNVPLKALPGVCKVDSAYANSIQSASLNGSAAMGRYIDMDGARFVAGFPEKIGGWATAFATSVLGVPRGLRDWRDNNQIVYCGIGTNKKLYYFSQGAITDITPWRAILTGTLSGPLATTSGSAIVTVTHTAHGLSTGDYIQLVAGTAVGGITPAGIFDPITKIDANTYSFVNITAATGNASSGGGTVSYIYYRITLSNPFDTVSGSPTVTVHHTANGVSVGDFVTISGSSAVGGITPSGEVVVVTAALNSWTFTWTSNATSTVTSGGGTPNFQYDISVGNASASSSIGYGTGGYSQSGYSQNSSIGIIVPPRVWALSHYGQQLLSCPIGGTIYVWDPTIGGRSYPLFNAPTSLLWMFITPERFVFALGATLAMQVAWPDQNDYTNWTPTPINTANSGRTLQEGAYLVGGIAVRDGVSMVFSNVTAYTFTYSGDNEIYDTQTAGSGSGLIGPLAIASLAGVAYWMGPSEFWTWNGAVLPMPSDDIRDYVFMNLNTSQSYKFVAAPNIAKKEIWFFYVSSASSEIDSYIIFHIDQQCWSIGTVVLRTSWIDRGLFSNPLATDANGFLYSQEIGNDANGASLDSYITFNPTTIAQGEKNQDISAIFVDFERLQMNASFNVSAQQYPQDTPTIYGPYTIADDDSTPRIDLRIGAKMIGYTLQSNAVGGDWRLGLPTVEVQGAGERR